MKNTIFNPGCIFLILFLCNMASMAQQRDTSRDYTVRINHYNFDPLKNPPQKDPQTDSANAKLPNFYQLIQFTNSLTREQINILRENGLALNEYIPNFTYIEWVNREQIQKISRLPFYRWSGNYEPIYKISRETGKGKFESEKRKAVRGLIINAVCSKHVPLQEIAARLKSQRFEVLQTFNFPRSNQDNRIRLRVNDMADVRRLAVFPEIKWIEEEGDVSLDNGNEAGLIQSNNTAQTPVYNNGIRGEGQIVGLIDAPLDMNHCFFNDALVTNAGPTHRKVVGFRQVTASPFGAAANCSSGHGTHTAGTIAGFSAGNADNGIAFNSRLTYGDLNDIAFSNSGGTQSFFDYLSEARNDGAFVHSNSWSDKNTSVVNTYTLLSQDLDNFTWNNEDQLVVVSSGNNVDTDSDGTNDSPSPMRPPFTSKNGLCVAASSAANTNNVATGGLGPTFDNRRKPDIYAPGSNTTSSQAGTNCTTFACSGSSMATPAIAAAGALVRQYFTEGWYPTGTKRPEYSFTPSGALLKATLLNSTRDMTGTDAFGVAAPVNGYPTNLEGWGELVLDDALFFNGDARNLTVWDVRHAAGLNTGEQDVYTLNVAATGQPLKITLVWQEPPAANANFGAPVINNLDLRVIAPNGTIFRGNNFAASQSAAGDGTTDQVNNVEMILVNTPQVGQWRIEIIGTTVNQGNPSQGYAVVATADTEDPPAPTGAQNTLVVLTQLPGTNPAGAPSQPNAVNLMTSVNTYITSASYGNTTINPSYVNVTLTTPLGTYLSASQNPLMEMAQDVVAQLVAANANVFTQGTATTTDDIDRIVILINDRNFTGDWATTGGWPYDLPAGLTTRLSVSVSSVFNDPDQRLAHAVCHQLGLMDLYAHPGVTFAQPHIDNWDIMSNLNRVQPMAWSKEKALWLSTNDPNSILWIPRPAAGASFDQSIPLNFLTRSDASQKKAIAIGLTPNVTTLANENVFFFIEARTNAAGTADEGLPGSGVLLYYVNENIRQGEGPARIIDRTPGTATLDDAQLDAVGQAHDLMGSYGLRVTRVATAGLGNMRVRVEYDPIETQHDVNIAAGDPYWTSPDIWVDNPENGYDATPADDGEQPIAGGTNRIYFRIHNPGPGTAFDVTVSVRLSEPHHTVGGVDDFNRFVSQKYYASIAPGADVVDYVDWTPVVGADPHNCIQVKIEDVFNDVNSFNNTAQENVDVQESSTASPYEAITFRFSATNPYDYYQLVYFRAENVPKGWTATFSEPKKLLSAHERYEGTLTVQPPDTAKVCTDRQIFVTSWMPRGNTIIQLGGATLQVNLRNRTTITATTTGAPCRDKTNRLASSGYSNAKCYILTTTGCTNPVRPNEEIIIRYEDPQGNPVYRTVMTDAMGCYSDTYVVAEGGEWKVTVKYPGSDCSGGSETGGRPIVVPLPGGNTPGGDQPGGGTFEPYLRKIWYSAHVGSTHPLGDLNRIADANIYAMADLTFPVNTGLNLQLLYGWAQMTNSNTTGDNIRWSHLSVNAQKIFARTLDMKPYLRAGVGMYADAAGVNTTGANIGLGGIVKISNQLYFSPGIDLHMPTFSSNRDVRPYFITAHIGLIFK